MSGGVDSSVSAALEAERGGDVVGVSMQLIGVRAGEAESRCCAPDDLRDARRVAEALRIPHFVLDFEDDFRRHVLSYFEDEYRRGRTPIPCVPCNSTLKFGRLLERARMLGAVRIVTGHYARVDHLPEEGRYRLRTGVDPERDQSYFLFDLTQEQLAAAVFPLGALRKDHVRELARRFRLPVADKPESRDLCFVGSSDYRDTLRRSSNEAGEIVDREGLVLGRHDGISGFTVGQRRGLGVAGGRRLYVLALDAARQRVVVGEEQEQYAGAIEASGANWISPAPPPQGRRAMARVRYRHAGASGWVFPAGGDGFRVDFDEPLRAPAPGQAAVLYDGDEVIGGGWIDRSIPAAAPAAASN
jgi:tRNA-specific 2-thiouridylase